MRAIILLLAVLLAPVAWAGERVDLPGFSFERPNAPWRQAAYYCPHPDNPAYIITLMYSTRLAPGAAPPFTKDGDLDSLAQSLVFKPLR